MSTTTIQEDLTVDGNIVAKEGTVAVSGRVNGDIDVKSIEILPTGVVKGAVSAADAKISGAIEGSVTCEALTLEAQSNVKADLSTGTLAVSSGAKVLGRVEVRGG